MRSRTFGGLAVFILAVGVMPLLGPGTGGAQLTGVAMAADAPSAKSVRALQRSLNILGYKAGATSGRIDGKTRKAIRRYQNAIGVRETGQLTDLQKQQLVDKAAAKLGPAGKHLRRAFSGGAAEATPPPVAAQSTDETAAFRILRNTDIPYNDLRTPRQDRRLIGTGVEGCKAACAANRRCAAFTYNQSAKWCFLKSATGPTARFKGAVSGVRQAAPQQTDRASAPAPVRDTDVAGTIRARAVSHGGTCDQETALIRKLQNETRLSAAQRDVRVGQDIALQWARGSIEKRLPVYLMVSSKTPVRFKGRGFYALMPGARAPFSLEWKKDTTRAIVPLYGRGVPKTGTVTVTPILAGGLNLEWSVIGYVRKCKTELASEATGIRVETRAGKPKVLADDPFSLKTPVEVIASSTGERLLHVFENFFRIVDPASGAIIAQREGEKPRFSPSGRFVAAGKLKYIGSFILFDAIDGAIIGTQDGFFGWSHGESFVVADQRAYGMTELDRTLVAGDDAMDGSQMSCFACSAFDDTFVGIDLENNIFITRSKGTGGFADSVYIHSLTSTRKFRLGDWANRRSRRPLRDATANIRQNWQVTEIAFPRGWVSDGGLQVTHLPLAPHEKISQLDPYWRQRLVPPRRLSGRGNAQRVASLPAGETRSIAWRGFERSDIRVDRDARRQRLSEFQLPAARATPIKKRWEGAEIYKKRKAIRRDMLKWDKRLEKFLQPTFSFYKGEKFKMNCVNFEANPDAKELNTLGVDSMGALWAWSGGGRDYRMAMFPCTEGGRAGMSTTHVIVFDKKHRHGWFALGNVELGLDNLSVIDGRYLFGWSSYAIGLYDLSEKKGLFSIRAETDDGREILPDANLIEDVFLTPDRTHLVQVNSDGRFFVYRVADKARVLEGRYVDDELIAWTTQGHYDATAEGAHFVNLQFPGEPGQFSFHQFEKTLRVRGLVAKVLAGEGLANPDTGVPPSLKVSLEAGTTGRITGTARIRAPGGLASLNIYQDGIVTDRLQPSGADGDIVIDVAPLPGTRWVSAVALDKAGLASRPMGRDLGSAVDGKSRIHLLAVGVDNYDDDRIADLRFARADALTLSDSVKRASDKRLALGSSLVMTDAEVSKAAILNQIRSIAETAEAGETIVFFFAGHGVRDRQGRFYLAMPGTDPDAIEKTALPWTEIAKLLKKAKARVLVFLDACHSGAAGTNFFATNDDAATGLLTTIPSGLVIVSASKGRQFSEEHPAKGGGLFTNAVADVIARKRSSHDRNGNGAIEISELYLGVKSIVARESAGRQTPWLARNQMVGDFALF